VSSASSSELERRWCRRSGTPPSETKIDSFEGYTEKGSTVGDTDLSLREIGIGKP